MLELYLIQHCAPTLAGVKSANLFTCPVQDAKMLQKMIDSHNQLLNPKGVHITLLRVRKSAALIYVYRPANLRRSFTGQKQCTFCRATVTVQQWIPKVCWRI